MSYARQYVHDPSDRRYEHSRHAVSNGEEAARVASRLSAEYAEEQAQQQHDQPPDDGDHEP